MFDNCVEGHNGVRQGTEGIDIEAINSWIRWESQWLQVFRYKVILMDGESVSNIRSCMDFIDMEDVINR